MQKRFLFLVSLLLIASLSAVAQITTSSLDGVVIDEGSSETVIGATVQAVHVPSGTKYSAITNSKGRFTIQGMRPGGPYTIAFTYIGYQGKTYNDVMLDLGETLNMKVVMSENTKELSEVVVSGKASKFKVEKTGASTNVNNATILEMPTVSHSISDIAKLSPYYGGNNSFAGSSGRSTNFTLDGANLNNNFGLDTNLPGGGSPVSLEAIEEVQMVVAPFDVRQSNFIGGGINAVTKSGTNTFKGTAYFYYTNEDMHGNRVDGQQNAEPTSAMNKSFGFTLGGPILKDKLFFFLNYEREESTNIPTYWHPSADGVADSKSYSSRASLADLATISEFVKRTYGYDTGSSTDYPGGTYNNKYLARLDWNITTNHHLAIRFNHTNNSKWSGPSQSRESKAGGTTAVPSIDGIAYANSFYNRIDRVTTISADLNSRFGEHASNQFLFTYSDQDAPKRSSDSAEFPFVDILKDGSPYITLGYELFTYNNWVRNKVLTFTDNFTYYLGAHKFTAGINFEHQVAFNNYMRNGTGYYRYASMEDFMTGAAPIAVALSYGYDGDRKPSSEVAFNQAGLYLQDEWNVLHNLKITAGVRFDDIMFNNSDLKFNQKLYELNFGGRHLDVGTWPKNNIQISPRVGFTWDVFSDKSLKVRGGTGLFAGRLPLVFFTNMVQNSGMLQNLVIAGSGDPRLSNFTGGLTTDVNLMREKLDDPKGTAPYSLNPLGIIPSAVAGVDYNFKMPQVWKTSIAIDYQLPVSFPLTVTGEFTYSKNINAARLDNWNMKNPDETWDRFVGADNRYIYPSNKASWNYYPSYQNVCVLTNTHEGYGWTANITINAEPVKNLNIMAAYTHTVNKEVTGMPGSNASSAWSYLHTINGPNITEAQNSSFVTPDRVIANISYKLGKEHFSLFYNGYSPSGYSYVYSNDLNGDGLAYDLMYIPANDSEIKFVSEADRVAFWRYVEQDDYLSSHKGEYAEAYSARAPWVHRFDFRWAHDFDLKIGSTKHKLQLIANIENLTNLFNSRWGVAKYAPNMSNSMIKLLSVAKKENNVPIFRMCTNPDGSYMKETWDYNHSYGQCWKLQIGVKYYFN